MISRYKMNGRRTESATTPLPLTCRSICATRSDETAFAAAQIHGPHDAAQAENLVLRIDLDVLGALDHQISVGEHLRHHCGNRRSLRLCHAWWRLVRRER